MASTYTPIATQTLGSSAASVTFSSIAGTYTDLLIVMNTKGSTLSNNYMQVNGDTGSNYSRTGLSGNGSAASSYRGSSQTKVYLDNNSATDSTEFRYNGEIHLMNYSNTTTYKTFLNRANNAAYGTEAQASLWRSTAAITSVTVAMDTGTYSAGSTFTLYGIKAA